MGVEEEVNQAKVVAWPSCLWLRERNQTDCCDVPTDLLLVNTVKAWVMELNVGPGFCQWNNRSNIRALRDKVWAISSCFLSSPALSMQSSLQVFEKSGLRKQPNYEHKPEPWWRVQLFLSKPSVCLSPGIFFYQYWSFQVIYFDSLHDDMIEQMLSAPASNEFSCFASYMDAKGHCPQVVRPWPIITSALINETGLSWLCLSILQGKGLVIEGTTSSLLRLNSRSLAAWQRLSKHSCLFWDF